MKGYQRNDIPVRKRGEAQDLPLSDYIHKALYKGECEIRQAVSVQVVKTHTRGRAPTEQQYPPIHNIGGRP